MKIFINSREYEFAGKEITFDEIAFLAHIDRTEIDKVIFKRTKEGELNREDKLMLTDKLSFIIIKK